ncbi:WhiB family transcriptional regulator [Nocardioides taihuensis]|uniref:WhiB family transcriptional regulator n=1 Tax=Nocardioides taihuensis TaxID=1835606 RepID=A0ABW0BEG3_9ACTN
MGVQWRALALCGGFPKLPWIAEPHRYSAAEESAMRTVCDACPVRPECAADADDHRIEGGFWSGAARTAVAGRLDPGGA